MARTGGLYSALSLSHNNPRMSPSLPLDDINKLIKSIQSGLTESSSAMRKIVDQFKETKDPKVLKEIDPVLAEDIFTLSALWKIKAKIQGESEEQELEMVSSLFMTRSAEKSTLISQLGQIEDDYKPAHASFYRNILALNSMKNELAGISGGKRLKSEIEEYSNLFQEIFSKWKADGGKEDIVNLRNKISIKILALNKVYPTNALHSKSNERALKCELAYEVISKLQKRFIDQAEEYLENSTKLNDALVNLNELLTKRNAKTAETLPKPLSKLETANASTRGNEPENTTSDSQKEVDKLLAKLRDQPLKMKALVPPVDVESKSDLSLVSKDVEIDKLIKKTPPEPISAAAIRNPKARKEINWSSAQIYIPVTLILACIAGYIGLQSSWGKSLGLGSQESTTTSFAGHTQNNPGPEDHVSSIGDHLSLLSNLADSTGVAADSSTEASANEFFSIQNPEYGIDVSHYQGDIDWATVASFDTLGEAIAFAIIKASEGTSTDPKFEQNWANAKKSLSKVGAYHYFSLKTDGVKQANHFIETVDLGEGDIRPIVDVESNCTKCFEDGNPSLEGLISNLNKYISTIEDHYKTKALVYTGEYFYRQYLEGSFPNQDFWLADYSKSKSAQQIANSHTNPKDLERAIMWQFSASGKLHGIEGAVDLNYLPGQYSADVLID